MTGPHIAQRVDNKSEEGLQRPGSFEHANPEDRHVELCQLPLLLCESSSGGSKRRPQMIGQPSSADPKMSLTKARQDPVLSKPQMKS
eukprot:6025711-Amphidinium_carterae.1